MNGVDVSSASLTAAHSSERSSPTGMVHVSELNGQPALASLRFQGGGRPSLEVMSHSARALSTRLWIPSVNANNSRGADDLIGVVLEGTCRFATVWSKEEPRIPPSPNRTNSSSVRQKHDGIHFPRMGMKWSLPSCTRNTSTSSILALPVFN